MSERVAILGAGAWGTALSIHLARLTDSPQVRLWARDVRQAEAMDRAREVLNSNVEYVSGPYDAAAGADALLILTEWEEFAALDLARLRKVLKYPIVIDGRNLYDPAVMAQHGFTYYSVGRPAALTEDLPAGLRPEGGGQL